MKHTLNKLVLATIIAVACMAISVPVWAGSINFGVDQSSTKIADSALGWLSTYGPGRNIAISGSGTQQDPTVLHVSFVDNANPDETATLKIGYLKGDVDPTTNAITWYRSQTVAEGAFMGNGAHIAVGKDSQGKVVPHLVWASDTALYYGRPQISPSYLGAYGVINTTATPDEFSRSIAADDNGVVHIAYVGTKNGVDGIYYARSEDSGSTFVETETLVEACNTICNTEPDITVDENGTPMVSYRHYDSAATPDYTMHIAVRGVNGQWTPQTVNTNYEPDSYSSISASGGRVCVAWWDYVTGYVVSSCSANGTWNWIESEITGLDCNFRASIALDSNGVASAVSSLGDDLYFSREKNQNSWQTSATIIATGDNIMDPKMAIDAADKAYIVFPNYNKYQTLEFTREK